MEYKIIEGSARWADKYLEFYRQAVSIYYAYPERGITPDLFSRELFSSPRIQRYFEELCENTANKKTWLAVNEQDNLLGVIAAERHANYCEFKAFYVRPDLQGQGIGKALFNRAEDFANDQTIRLDVVEYMTDTIAMYKRWGFEIDRSKGKVVYPFIEWPEAVRQKFRGIYMVRPAKN
jgi:GNAT superfamily N-acetyltransferase